MLGSSAENLPCASRMGFGEGWRPTLAQSSGKQYRHQVYDAATGFGSPAPNHRFLYSGGRHTVLSPPAFEQCPSSRGCAPTGPLRPSIGAHLKGPSAIHRSARTQETARAPVPATRAAKPRVGVSRWQALERAQFRALIASPSQPDRSKGGSKSC